MGEWWTAEDDEFWRPLVYKLGVLDEEAVQRELHDYHGLLREVPKVYDHVTDGRISKPNTLAFEVIGQADGATTRWVEREMSEMRDGIRELFDAHPHWQSEIINEVLREMNHPSIDCCNRNDPTDNHAPGCANCELRAVSDQGSEKRGE